MSKPYPSALAYILQTRCSLTCRKGGCAHCHVFWWCLAMRGQQRWWSEVLLRYFTPFTVLSASVEQKGYMHTKAVFSWLFCGPVEGKPDFNCWTEICGHHVESGCKSLENFIIYQEVKQKFREAQFSVHLQCLFFCFFFLSPENLIIAWVTSKRHLCLAVGMHTCRQLASDIFVSAWRQDLRISWKKSKYCRDNYWIGDLDTLVTPSLSMWIFCLSLNDTSWFWVI